MKNTIPPYLPKLVRGELSNMELPEELDLSFIDANAKWLCQHTLVHPLEHGVCMVWSDAEKILWTMHEVIGAPDNIYPDCEPEAHPCDVIYVGFFHTHLPDKYEGVQIGFSELDYKATLADGDSLSIVHNGREFFALVRTQETWPRGKVSDDVYKRWVDLLDEYFDDDDLTTEEAYLSANLDICQETGFALYKGVTVQQLRKVFPTTEESVLT